MEPHLIHVSRYSDSRGTLGVIDKNIFDEYKFETRRCFYISDVLEDGSRGAHAHLHCTQIILLTSGELMVDVRTPLKEFRFELTLENPCLYIPPMHWGVQYGFSNKTSYVVLADREYNENEYIRDYRKFLELWSEANES